MPEFVRITVRERGAVPRSLERIANRSVGAGLQAAAEQHHREFVPNRFTKSHARKARYLRRSPEYQRRKRREGRGDDPMVYTGRTRARASVARRTSTNKRVRLVYSLPTLNLKVGRRGRRRSMRTEFEKVTGDERRSGQRLAMRVTNDELRRDTTVSQRRLL